MFGLKENEIYFKKIVNEKRIYFFSVKKKKTENNFLLTISEKLIEDGKNYKPNKIRIYEENLDDFFDCINEIREKIKEIKGE